MSLASTLESYLTDHAARYTIEHHSESMTSLDTARIACIDEESLAKSVLLEDDRGFVLAVLPASRRLELARVRDQLGRALHLCHEYDMARVFPDCKRGAIPPIGAAYGLQTVVDASLEDCEEVFFEGGDHETLVRMEGGEFLDLLEDASVVEIACDSERLTTTLALRERLYVSLLAVRRAIAAPIGNAAPWCLRLRRQLVRVVGALDEHIDETEGPNGLLSEIALQAPRLWREVDGLRLEHTELREECARVLDQLDRAQPLPSIRARVHALLARFEEHRHRGADLVYEAFGVDIGGG